MAATANRIFVSIGVSRPTGDLEVLPGAITASERMAQWAAAHGYKDLLINDALYPEVTVDLLRDEISAAIAEVTDRATLTRLVVFFAGHGLAQGEHDQYWLLTNWYKRSTEAIKVSSLQRMLEYYGPKQVSVIGDACQEFSDKLLGVTGSAVLDRPDEDPRTFELDQFFAVDSGKQAFMIKAKGEEKAFCLFTEVLLDALEGDFGETYFETVGADKVVTSQSIARHLAENVSVEAGKYGVRMSSAPRPGFYTDRVYFTRAEPDDDDPQDDGTYGLTVGFAAPDRSPRRASRRRAPAKPRRAVGKIKLVESKGAQMAANEVADALAAARAARREAFVDQVGAAEVRDHFETGCGICVSGTEVDVVEASRGEVSTEGLRPGWFRIDLGDSFDRMRWTDALITLADGRTAAACVINGFVTALHIGDAATSVFHRAIGASDYEGQMAVDLLARMHAGVLSASEIVDSAAMLREGKHRVITLGCIAAQFYDAVRDVDSLRQIAAYYAIHGQPVPLDVVLYGGGTIHEHDGRLHADIPAVSCRKPRTDAERVRLFTYEETPAFENYPVAGRVPWLRQAWSAVETARCRPSADEWRESALAVLPYLEPGALTLVGAQGRDALAALAGVEAESGAPAPLTASA